MDIIKITGIPPLDLEILQKDQDEGNKIKKGEKSKENDKTKKSVQNSKRKMPRN